MHYILSRYNNVERSASHPISFFESSHFLVRHQANKKFRGLWQQDCFASFWFLEATIFLVSANISLLLTKTLSASGNENVAKTARFLSFAESKRWATKLIVVTTCVGPIKMYLPLHSFLHIHRAPSLVQLRRIGDGPAPRTSLPPQSQER